MSESIVREVIACLGLGLAQVSKIEFIHFLKRRFQRKFSRKCNKLNNYYKSKNAIKNKKEILVVCRKLTNTRKNYLHQTSSEIVNRKPMFICLEDLNVSGMMKNRCLSKAIQQQSLYELVRQLEYKSLWNNIKFVLVDRWFPSSKTCSSCKTVKDKLKLSDRIYKCEVCDLEIDRDYNASLNLKYWFVSQKLKPLESYTN